jgi:tRNA pseudouridine55 synthase
VRVVRLLKSRDPHPTLSQRERVLVFKVDGILNIDKAGGMTSHDVVQTVRKKFGMSKVGHLGTLDPMATGVLPVCTGKATRLAQFLPSFPKEYEGEIRFGFPTNTYDREGVATKNPEPLEGDAKSVREAMMEFLGAIDQTPPPYSAKKIGGVPSYKLARRNQAVEMTPVRVEIEKFDLLSFNPPFATFRVICSAGTYIRSLVHELGGKIGCGAHLNALRRTRSGDFRIEDAVKLEGISHANILPIDRLLSSWPRIEVSDAEEIKVIHGNEIRGAGSGDFARIFNKKGEFIALASTQSGWVRPTVVLTSINSD